MAVRNFDGTAGFIRFAQAVNLTGAFSIFAVVKRNADAAFHSIFTVENSGGTTVQWSLELDNANLVDAATNSLSATDSLASGLAADGWVIVGVTKAAGAVTPRLHVYKAGGWTQRPASQGTRADQASITGGRLVIGQWKGSDQLNARVACVAVWQGTALSDAQVLTLAGKTRAQWINIGGTGACTWGVVLDQASTGTAAVPFVGSATGAQSAITGTSVITSDDPPTTVFDLAGAGVTYTKTGAAEAPYTGSGADAVTVAESGSAATPLAASGTSAVTSGTTVVKAGTAALGVLPKVKTGTAQTALAASGVRATSTSTIYAKTGTGISVRAASGPKTLGAANIITKSGRAVLGIATYAGTGVRTLTASGSKVVENVPNIVVKSGGGAGGSGTPMAGLLSLTRAVGWQASGPKSTNLLRAGMGITTRAGQAADAVTTTETGAATSIRVGSGASAVSFTIVKTGTGATRLLGSGGREAVTSKTGTGALDYESAASHAQGIMYNRTGAGITALDASGARLGVLSRTGAAVTALSAAGLALTSGLNSTTYRVTGSASYDAKGSAATVLTFIRGGTGISARSASGSKLIPAATTLYTLSGSAAMSMGARGTGAHDLRAALALAPSASQTEYEATPIVRRLKLRVDSTELDVFVR